MRHVLCLNIIVGRKRPKLPKTPVEFTEEIRHFYFVTKITK